MKRATAALGSTFSTETQMASERVRINDPSPPKIKRFAAMGEHHEETRCHPHPVNPDLASGADIRHS